MDQPVTIPTVEDIKNYLEEYGWKYRETTADNGQAVIISPYTLENEAKGILLSFRIEGEFVMVSTVGLLKTVPIVESKFLLDLNDTLKLVKLFTVETHEDGTMAVELGFELWDKSWNRDTFFSFMDMLCLGIEKVFKNVADRQLPHETSFVSFG